MSTEASEALAGAVAFTIVCGIVGIALGIKLVLNEFSANRKEARIREDKLHNANDKLVGSLSSITESLRKVDDSLSQQARDTTLAIGAISKTTERLASDVQAIDKTLVYVVEKVTEQERRESEYVRKYHERQGGKG